MKYIVTGASGLIGSALIWALNKRGETDILAVDHLGTSEKWKNLRALQFREYLERDDFAAVLDDRALTGDTQVILHMGACSSTTEKDATYLIHNNFEYTKMMVQFALENKIRFLYASSAATYGDGACGYRDDESMIEELRPLNMYGYSKQMFDLWAKNHGLLDRITGVKYTNVFGPNERHKGEMRSVIHKAYEQIQQTGRMKLFKSANPQYADGEFMRDFLYVKDAVDMVLFIIDHDLKGLYNIGSGRAETWNSLALAIFKALGMKPAIDYVEMPEHLKAKYQYYTKAEMTKLHAAGYSKTVRPLEESVHDYICNYLLTDRYLGDQD